MLFSYVSPEHGELLDWDLVANGTVVSSSGFWMRLNVTAKYDYHLGPFPTFQFIYGVYCCHDDDDEHFNQSVAVGDG